MALYKSLDTGTSGGALRLLSITMGMALVVLLGGCSGKGCFGLCDARDEDESTDEPPPSTGVDTSCISTGTTTRQQVTFPYALEGTSEQTLNFYASALASDTEPRPVLVWVTGDTWQSNVEANDAPSIARAIADRLGAHYAPMRYRASDEADWPAQIVDVKTAIRFLKSQADLNIDREKIYIGGDQAGAHLAALAAYTNGEAAFAPDDYPEQDDVTHLLVALGGIYDFETILADNDSIAASCPDMAPAIDGAAVRRLFNCDLQTEGEAELVNCDLNDLIAASPVQHIGSDDPPALIYHGDANCEVPSAQSTQLDAVYSSGGTLLQGNRVFTLVAGDDDSLDSLSATTVVEDLVEFADFDCDDDT